MNCHVPALNEIKMMEKTSVCQRSIQHLCLELFKKGRGRCEVLEAHLVGMGHFKPEGNRDTPERLTLWANHSRAGHP